MIYPKDSPPDEPVLPGEAEPPPNPLVAIAEAARERCEALNSEHTPSREALIQAADELARLAHYLSQINRERSEFLSKVSHELRTPLTIAKGWISMLRHGRLMPEQERVVAVVDQQVDELTRLVNDLLDLSRRETGELSLSFEVGDLGALAERVGEHQRDLTSQRGIALRVHTPDEPVYARIDRGRIAQVLNNMIANAFRYVPHFADGRIELAVDRFGGMARLSVRDNGVGIAAEHLPRIFEPFYQVRSEKRGKTGLGLAIAREIVKAHGGLITAESAPGEGATFRIWLRRTDAEGTPAASDQARNRAPYEA